MPMTSFIILPPYSKSMIGTSTKSTYMPTRYNLYLSRPTKFKSTSQKLRPTKRIGRQPFIMKSLISPDNSWPHFSSRKNNKELLASGKNSIRNSRNSKTLL